MLIVTSLEQYSSMQNSLWLDRRFIMANPLLLDIVLFLTSKGVVEGDGIDSFRDVIPEKPDCLVALTEYKGSPLVNYEEAAHRSVQVLVRDKDADVARSKALEIFKTFNDNMSESARIDLTESRWGQVTLRQLPIRIDTDKSNRVSYIFNIGITTTIE